MTPPSRRTCRVTPEAKGARLDQHLAIAFPDLSRSRLQALVDSGCVRVDGRPAKRAQRLRGGEFLVLEVPEDKPATLQPEDLPLRVLHEDPDLIVIDKAPGMVVHPAAGHAQGTLVNALLHRVKDLGAIGGTVRPGVVHRLDKETSGCLVVAKNEPTLQALQAAFKGRTVDKRYLALVHGVPKDGRIETFYGRHPVHRKRFTGKVREGKRAVTDVRVVEPFGQASLVEATLHTGRTHQIRVHLSESGHPLLGDPAYGKKRRAAPAVEEATAALGRLALHAHRLAFEHPRDGRKRTFEAPLPEDFERALAVLRAAG